MEEERVWAGVDVGARRLHAAALDGDGRLVDVQEFAAADLGPLLAWLGGCRGIAVDSPDGWSTGPHAGDDTLSPKFRIARCAEVALGREAGMWVPWTTPREPRPGSWMEAGVRLFGALRAAGHDPAEVYPHAVFRTLAGPGPLPPKTGVPGRRARAQLLAAAGAEGRAGTRTSHHFLDATAAALVARQRHQGRAQPVGCGHDGSAIWLPEGQAGFAADRAG